jgi:hypothetical protein
MNRRIYIPEGYKLIAELKTKRVQLVMRPSVLNRAKQKAENMDLSFNEFVHIAIDYYLDTHK